MFIYSSDQFICNSYVESCPVKICYYVYVIFFHCFRKTRISPLRSISFRFGRNDRVVISSLSRNPCFPLLFVCFRLLRISPLRSTTLRFGRNDRTIPFVCNLRRGHLRRFLCIKMAGRDRFCSLLPQPYQKKLYGDHR